MINVLIIGDSCTDEFQYGICERISPEAPVPIFKPTQKKSNAGMAFNLFKNIVALDVEANILTNNPLEIIKTRYVDEISNQMLLRVDNHDYIKHKLDTLQTNVITNTEWDGIIISDYNKGFLTKDAIQEILKYCKENNILTFLDTKKQIGEWVFDVNFIKINEKEYQENEGNFDNFKNQLIITLGNRGAKHFNKEVGTITKYDIEDKAEVRDLSGAGDTFLAGFVADYLKNDDIASAIKFANRCASYVVTQKGVVVVDKNKI